MIDFEKGHIEWWEKDVNTNILFWNIYFFYQQKVSYAGYSILSNQTFYLSFTCDDMHEISTIVFIVLCDINVCLM